MKKFKKIIIILVFISSMSFILNKIYAANASIKTSSDVETGTVTITATVTAAQWNLDLKVNGQSIANSSELENYEQNITKEITGTYNASSPGTLNISLSGDITDVNTENTIIKENKTIQKHLNLISKRKA